MKDGPPAQRRLPRRRSLIVYASDLDEIRFDPSDKPEHERLLEKLDPPPADGVLQALRSSFSITYDRYDSYAALPEKLATIRRQVVVALRPLNALLIALKLKPIGDDKSWPKSDDQIIHNFSFADAKELRLKVVSEDKKTWLTGSFDLLAPDIDLAAALAPLRADVLSGTARLQDDCTMRLMTESK